MVGKDYQWRVSGIFTNIILILRSGMKKVIKRIFLGVFALVIFALGAGSYRLITSLRFQIMSLKTRKFRNQ